MIRKCAMLLDDFSADRVLVEETPPRCASPHPAVAAFSISWVSFEFWQPVVLFSFHKPS